MSITLQPWKLKLLSIPKAYPQSIASCTHAIVKNIFFPRRDTLFSFTQNALELAIVADVNVIADDFLSLNLEGMMVTDDVFCAFMVDDPDGIDNSGRRINELSALLSRNGISIFYLSTRITDLILVKEKRLKLVLPTIRSIFSLSVDSDCDLSSGHHSRSGGLSSESDFGSFPGSSFTSMNSFLHTPSSPARHSSSHFQFPNSLSFTTSATQQPFQPHFQQQGPGPAGASLSSSYTRPSTGISIPFGRRTSYGNFFNSNRGRRDSSTTGGYGSGRSRQFSESDTSSVDGLGTSLNPHGTREHPGRQNSIAESSFGEGIGRFFPKRHPHRGSIDSIDSTFTTHSGFGNASIGNSQYIGRYQDSGENAGLHPLAPAGSSLSALGSIPSFGLMQETLAEQEEREYKTKEQIRKSCPRSVIDDKLMLAGLAPEYQADWAVTLLKVLFYPEQLAGFSSDSESRFISFTVTDEGTSLIADQEVLAQFEEHMLNMSSAETMLRCIQVDLSTFGLDTYGLVYSMSNPLVDHGVNLLCLSTIRTANVLVHDSDLENSLKILSLSG
ncbi:GATS protein-like 3 [Lunasporangiospora selenospora]|uniref:GATS protein-like 3 n=1 Tax=Lunasporangiospora selenospora TaxID=979761 RepID=A0A9P6KHD3_9FUNG|nr:GATS protein-like 3 [Lunasporangiospora selenospora]